nr:PKD domain-containing protein [Candidatus Gracilibacteria bacterium]
MKILKILFLIIYLGLFKLTFALSVPVETVFSDITQDYKYYTELQDLYDKQAIYPDENGKFNPYKLLTRDEFVGISLEVSCKKCTVPNTPIDIINTYSGTNLFFDIDKTNKYFYCIALADDKNYVKGYDPGYTCDNGVYKVGERPFCPSNNITLEEAIAVILRNSNLFSIEDNALVMQDIKDGKITENLSTDVSPKNPDGTPYTFYGYLRKALTYTIEEYDNLGNKKTYNLLELQDGKIYPKRLVTKEDFLKMAYIALKTNACKNLQTNNLSLKIGIFDKSCNSYDSQCKLSDLKSDNNIYDFKADVGGVCKLGVNDPDGYIWRFYNNDTKDEIIKYGKYLNDFTFLGSGNWTVYLKVIDNCGNTGEVYNTIYINGNYSIKADKTNGTGPLDVNFEGIGGKTGYTYKWDFGDGTTGDGQNINHEFTANGEYIVKMIVYDENGNKVGEDTKTITVGDYTIKADKTNGTGPLDVNFEGIGGKTGYTYKWDFGDGTTGDGQNINHEFTANGEYIVKMIVYDENGNKVGEDTKTITVGDSTNSNISVSIDATPISGNTPSKVDFSSIVTGGNGNYIYEWNFGNGDTGNGSSISYIYKNPGIYNVVLKTIDSNGNTGYASVLIIVNNVTDCNNDSDNDGVNDCVDLCPLIIGVGINSGCPVFDKKCASDCSCSNGYICSSKDTNLCGIKGVCLPNTEILKNSISDCLKSYGLNNIFGNASCNTCPCSNFLDFESKIRKCDLLFPAITSPDSTKIYSNGGFYEVK